MMIDAGLSAGCFFLHEIYHIKYDIILSIDW